MVCGVALYSEKVTINEFNSLESKISLVNYGATVKGHVAIINHSAKPLPVLLFLLPNLSTFSYCINTDWYSIERSASQNKRVAELICCSSCPICPSSLIV